MLILLLVDGNAVLDRIAEYDPAAARAARIGVDHCLDAPTAAVLCDRLVATFRQESEIGSSIGSSAN